MYNHFFPWRSSYTHTFIQTKATWGNRTCPRFETASVGLNPGPLDLETCALPTRPPRPTICVRPFGPFLLRCILGQTQTQIPDVIPCYFIVKCSGFVIHHTNLSHVYGSATAEACPTSTRRVTKHSGFSLVNHFLTCCCDGCCQMTDYARNSNVQVSFMKLVALSNYRIKDTSLLNI